MHISRIFFAYFLIIACSAHTMENESSHTQKNSITLRRRMSLSPKKELLLKNQFTLFCQKQNRELLLQLIDNTRELKTADEDIHIMVYHLKALSLTNKNWYNRVNSPKFTRLFIDIFARCFNCNKLRIANQMKTAGEKIWTRQYLKESGFNF